MKKAFYNILLVLLVILLCFSLYKIINWIFDNNAVKSETKQIEDKIKIKEVLDEDNLYNEEDQSDDYWDYVKLPFIDVNIKSLKDINNDTVAYINIPSTNINYPVVQTSNNEYYLNHSFKKKTNSAGWVFMDYRNNINELDKNTIIYGHGRVNGSMFGTLKNTLKNSWLKNKDNHIVRISSENENSMWQVFSVYSIETESYYLTTKFNSDKSYQKFLDTIKSRSIHDFNTTLNENDKVLTLSTCKNNDNERIVLHAKLIKTSTK